MKRITYSQVGDNYNTKDPIKKLVQKAASGISANLKKHGFLEKTDLPRESGLS